MSFGFQVRNMESNGLDVGSVLSGESEGFRSAQATPVPSIARGYVASEYRSGSTISNDSASFHTPNSYESEDEHVNLSLDIPDFEATPTSTYDIQTTPTMSDTYIPEQPKLALREDEEMGGANSNATKDGSLHNEYKKEEYHRNSGQSIGNHSNERTPLLSPTTNSENTSCCLLF